MVSLLARKRYARGAPPRLASLAPPPRAVPLRSGRPALRSAQLRPGPRRASPAASPPPRLFRSAAASVPPLRSVSGVGAAAARHGDISRAAL